MTFENKNIHTSTNALLEMLLMEDLIADLENSIATKRKMTMEEEAALYKEVTGKDLVYIPIEDTEPEFQAALHYFAELGGTEK